MNSFVLGGCCRREAYFYKLDDPEWQEAGLAYLSINGGMLVMVHRLQGKFGLVGWM
ncbi:MAG: hypothetical protein ACLU4J_06555 [Butyricimonas paravirosa]